MATRGGPAARHRGGLVMRALPAALLLLVAPVTFAQSPPAGEAAANPFFQEWTTPFGVPPFDQIRTEHFLPAIQEGMAQHEREV
jgi:peptidyl-dipeptidase Dcp